MKKRIIIIFFATLLLFCACVPTPEEEVVISKDQDVMLEISQIEKERPVLFDLKIPESRYSCSYDDDESKLAITVDAEVIVPDTDKLTIRTVFKDVLRPEQIKALYPLLAGDRQMVNTGKFGEARTVADGTMIETEYGYVLSVAEPFSDGAHMIARAEENDSKEILARSNGGELRFFTSISYSPSAIRYSGSVPESIESLLGISYEKAKEQVDRLMNAAGLTDVTIGQVFLVNNGGTGLSDGNPDKQNSGQKTAATRYAFQFFMTRTVDGIPLMTSLSTKQNINKNEQYASSWNYECICVTVDKDGIASFEWISPLRVGSVLHEEVHLLPFDQVMEIFEKMLRVHYSGILSARYPNGSLTVDVDRIELCLVRIRKQGGSSAEGLLIPGWVFYGHTSATDSEGWTSYDFITIDGAGYTVPVQPQTLLIINAIDGSIIDPLLGY